MSRARRRCRSWPTPCACCTSLVRHLNNRFAFLCAHCQQAPVGQGANQPLSLAWQTRERRRLAYRPPVIQPQPHQVWHEGVAQRRELRGARLQGVRQDPDSPARRDRRQQAAVGRVGADQGAAGRLPGASAARACCAAATAEQPRGAGSAVEGAGTTPPCCRGFGLRQRTGWRAIATAAASLGVRYVTELPPAKLPPSCRGESGFLRDWEIYPDA